MLSLPGNNLADALAKVGTIHDPPPYHSLTSYFLPTPFPVQQLDLRSLLALSRLRCYEHSSLLATYLHRISRAETSSCSNFGFKSQDIFHIVLDCPALTTPSTYKTSNFVPGSCPRDYWDSSELIRALNFRNGSGKPTTISIGENGGKWS